MSGNVSIEKYNSTKCHRKTLKYMSTDRRLSQVLRVLGTQFTDEIFKNINNILHVNLMHISIAHLQANGVSKRIPK